MNKFAPLTPAEIAAADPVADLPQDAGECIMPVPPDAPAAPTSHPSHGEASLVWRYLDSDGVLLFEVHRFDPPGERKQFAPLSLWRMPDGLRWRWKSAPAPRPLYGLDKLAEKPDAPVIICEGEKAAGAAARVFVRSVCVASPGGSQSADKADWSPLAGRKVLLWPDADAPGDKYARDVAAVLHGLDCDVSTIDAPALARMSPDGGTREPMQGWDCADAVEEWPDLRALAKAAHGLAKSYEPGPAYVSFDPFTMAHNGLTVEVEKGRGDNRTRETVWIAGRFEILGACRDPHGRAWGKLLRWRDGDGREHVKHVSEAALQGEPAALCASLADEGLPISRNRQRDLALYLASARVKGRVAIVHRTGWHEVGGRPVFVLPQETIGMLGAERVILDASAVGPYETRGTLADWRAGVASLAGGHALPVLAISAALAGPLLDLAGQEGGGLNVYGESSKGKTTLLQIAASVWGRGGSPGYVRAWRATANGLEGAAASASDTALVLDELGVVEARDAAAAVYGLANGSGKARAARDGSLREPKTWRVLLLSSGEVPIAAKLAEDRGRKARAGQFVRLLDIPADRGAGFGAFDNGGPGGEPAALAKLFKAAATTSYGTAGPEFVRRLLREGVTGEDVRAMVAEFVAAVVPAGSDGQIDRAAQRLGLVGMAGEIAAALGVTQWREGEAREAAAWAFETWLAGRGGTEPAEVRQAVEQVRLMIEQHGESRFEDLDNSEVRPVNNRLGWRKGEGSEREWWIPPQIWKEEICAGLDPTLTARVLRDRGALRMQGGDTFQCTVKVGGLARRAYVVTAGIVAGGGDGV